MKKRLVPVLLLFSAALCPLLVDSNQATCEMVNSTGFTEDQCPIKMTPVQTRHTKEGYSQCISVSVWMKAGDFPSKKSRKVEVGFLSNEMIFRPIQRGHSNQTQIYNQDKARCQGLSKHPYALVKYNCIEAEAKTTVSVSYDTKCSMSYTVADPPLEFSFSVNMSSKTVSISFDSDKEVHVRICEEQTRILCQGSGPRLLSIKSAVLNMPHILPCTCIEVYYTYRDAKRYKKCPFQNEAIPDVTDVWKTSDGKLYKSHIEFSFRCPARGLNISASLCWKQHEHLCIPVLNSTLEKKEGGILEFNTQNVDKHPQMCVQSSLQGSLNITCLFGDEKPFWRTSTEAGRQSIVVLLTSTVPANFSAQLCVLTERDCTPRGEIHSLTMTENTADKRIYVPVQGITEKLCVQVWQSGPALKGRRILCQDYTHSRWGLYVAVVLIFAVLAAFFGHFLHRTTKSGTAGLLTIRRPLLLVCSSDQPTHISALCALASILQGKLGATVHAALWQQNSQRRTGSGAGVADLGPIPWLYGQWEATCKAQGKVLIFWSPEAKRSYERWKVKKANADKKEANASHENVGEEDLKLFGKWKKEKKCFTELLEDKDWCSQKGPSTVTEPVFMAALASLKRALQEGKGKDVAIVYFQGLCHSKDIPKAFREVPRYCLPRDFSDLIQELAEVRGGAEGGEFSRSCGHRLLSKVKSVWLARQLAQRLQTVLHQAQRHEATSDPSSTEMTSDWVQSQLTMPRSEQERELL
ncbi:interleukin-17 receptor E [Austrofundulus limnaeus]|uniref:Interleukin-17 receptor E n=1 Tax=Austrofundulus limnaeus TaxID=52670 RepID=A0A2I4BU64_AUSLI|nr:PREDICTED: interleukin-17 receptor E [Austrofundulus limnaeus]